MGVRGLTNSQYYTEIGEAIRIKLGVDTTYKPSQMAAAIRSITTRGNIVPLTITENGEIQPPSDVDGYAPITIQVPNTYTVDDLGKVVWSAGRVEDDYYLIYDYASAEDNLLDVEGAYTENNLFVPNLETVYTLVPQLSKTINSVGTYDTTLASTVVVDLVAAKGQAF